MIQFTQEYLEKLENSASLKSTYAGQGAFGHNKLIYIPVIIAFTSALMSYFLFNEGILLNGYGAASLAVLAISVILIITIYKKSKADILKNVDKIDVSIAKKIYGNDKSESYYVIFTTGKERHNPEFIEKIAEKIFNIKEERVFEIREKIEKMFSERWGPGIPLAEQLPVEFTFGEKVYMKVENCVSFSPGLKSIIEANNDKFALIVFEPTRTTVIREKDLESHNVYQI